MCKIVSFSNATKLDMKQAARVIGTALNKLEPDGFGYAVQGQNGQFGEKSVKKSEKFSSRFNRLVVSLPFIKMQASTFGTVSEVVGPAIFHGRTSTNNKGLKNCHPMQRDGWGLIHNGVVTDHGPKYEKFTTNDSEDVLARLILGIDQVEAQLTGYYAFSAIDPAGKLHIGRDSLATLFCAWSESLESYVFATTESLIRQLAKQLKFSVGVIDAVEDNVYFVMDGNAIASMATIKPRGYERHESQHATASLGRSLDSSSYTSGVYDYSRRGLAREETVAVQASWLSDDSDDSKSQGYYDWRRQLDAVDESYSIYDSYGRPVTVAEFHRMDHWSQEDCNILKPNGGVLQRYGDRKRA